MKKGLPNSLPLPNSCPKPSQVFWQCPFSFALFFGNHMQVAPEDLFKHYVPIKTKDFVCFSAMPLFLCDVLLIVPASTSHLLSDTASVEQAQLDGGHCC